MFGRDWLLTAALRPSVKRREAVKIFNNDDDLVELRRRRRADVRRLFLRLGQLTAVRMKATGDSFVGGGCVSGDTLIAVQDSCRFARELVPGDLVRSGWLGTTEPAHLTRILGSASRILTINGKIDVSPTQHFLELSRGWVLARNLRVGMTVMRQNGEYERINKIVKSRHAGLVYGFLIASGDHTFVANGYVCHNDMKG